jgi:hypothetical protein
MAVACPLIRSDAAGVYGLVDDIGRVSSRK